MALPLVELLFTASTGDDDVHSSGSSRARDRTYRPGNDSALVERIRFGDEAAFTQVVYELTPVLHAYARQYLPFGDVARDVIQDVFLRLWDERRTLVVRGTLRQYLFIATRLRAFKALRRVRVEQRYAGEGPLVSAEPPLDESVERLDRFVQVVRAVDDLPPRQREIVRLRWLDGLSNTDVAMRLGISVKGVEVQLTRALYSLRKKLRRDDVG